MAKASKKAEDKMRREREKLEKQEKQDAKKRRRANKTEEETKKKEPEPSGASNKRKAKDMGPVEPSAPEEADVVAAAFQRLQAVGIDHFDVDLKAGRKSVTVKPPMGSGASFASQVEQASVADLHKVVADFSPEEREKVKAQVSGMLLFDDWVFD